MKFDPIKSGIEHLSGLNFLGLSPIDDESTTLRRAVARGRTEGDGDCDPDPVVMASTHGRGWPRADHHWIDSSDVFSVSFLF